MLRLRTPRNNTHLTKDLWHRPLAQAVLCLRPELGLFSLAVQSPNQGGDWGLVPWNLVGVWSLGFGVSFSASLAVLLRNPGRCLSLTATDVAATIAIEMKEHRSISRSFTRVNVRQPSSDFAFWQSQPYSARLAALELIRREYHRWRYGAESRLQRVYTIVKR